LVEPLESFLVVVFDFFRLS